MDDGAGRTVLVVEDDLDTRAIYRMVLENAGWEVVEAESGDQALRQAAGRPPSAAVVDISIPGVDGWETTRRLKSDPATRAMPVIAVTGHALDEDRERARASGCDAYLVKPVPPQRLLEEVRRLTGRE